LATCLLEGPPEAAYEALKTTFGGEHMDSNQRLMYTWACASPQKCLAVGLLAAFKSHFTTASL